MKLNVYGKLIQVVRKDSQWLVYYLGNEGKKRIATDISIPSDIIKDNIADYVADLCHEWATPNNNEVSVI